MDPRRFQQWNEEFIRPLSLLPNAVGHEQQFCQSLSIGRSLKVIAEVINNPNWRETI